MPSPNDYLGVLTEEPEDAEHVGVKGMKWGVRKDRSSGSKEAGPPKLSTAKEGETSPERYARIQSDAKAGNTSLLSDEDLQFFNKRTEAINKVNKLDQKKPGWLGKTAGEVLQQTAKNTMVGITSSLANKYIGEPAAQAASKRIDKGIAKAAVKVAARKAARKV